MQNGKAPRAESMPDGLKTTATLKQIVKEALLSVLADSEASAAAKASAGRTLLQYFQEENESAAPRGADMTAAELDSAIRRFRKPA
jgi:hypothetical protein